MELTLVIANKNYSSWSLRAWLLLKHIGAPFREIRVPLGQPDTPAQIRQWSPSGLVPALLDGELAVWDSLAIGEYLHEKFPAARLWPEDFAARARARSICAEVHSGFSALRQSMPFNGSRHFPGRPLNAESQANVERISAIWRECRADFADTGPFLFGHFTIADAMYTPVALRFLTYDAPLDAQAATYAATLAGLASVQEWLAAARQEPQRIAKYEPAPL